MNTENTDESEEEQDETSNDSTSDEDENSNTGWKRVIQQTLDTLPKPEDTSEWSSEKFLNEPDFSNFFTLVQNEAEELLADADNLKCGSIYEKIERTKQNYISKEGYTEEAATEAAWDKHKILVKRKLQESKDQIDHWIQKNWIDIDSVSTDEENN